MAGADRLSDLSDDLLAYVISFLDTREAVRTAALSRRWRTVWLRTHSLILDSKSYGDRSEDYWAYVDRQDYGTKDRLFYDAVEFLDATGRCNRVRKLSLSVHGRKKKYFKHIMGWGESRDDDTYDLMASLLAAPELRHLEEVRVNFEVIKREPDSKKRVKKLSSWVYQLDPAKLPGQTLRVLDLEYCRLESPPDSAAVSFPRLSSLRLYKCSSSTKDLEGWISTAPSLGSVHIQDHDFYSESDDTRRGRFALHSPSLTTLTLVPGHCTREHFELDVPSLRAFKYNGKFQGFSLKSQTTELVRVDLTVQHIHRINRKEVQTWFAPFWELLRTFRHAKSIKLNVPAIEGIAVDKDVQHEHLFTLQYLERIEVRGFSDPDRKDDAALAIANLLQCCPVIHDLRIQIPTDPYRTQYLDYRSKKVPVSDFDVSMDVFRRRFSKEMVPLMLDQDDGCSQAPVLPGLTGSRFDCLENHLKSVTLQFEFKDLNSFEVCLAKFFVANCRVLEVLQIHDGKQTFLSHLNWMVERWRANAPKQRNQMECDSPDSSKQRSGKRKRNYRVCNAE